jgi:hypothetical protein
VKSEKRRKEEAPVYEDLSVVKRKRKQQKAEYRAKNDETERMLEV